MLLVAQALVLAGFVIAVFGLARRGAHLRSRPHPLDRSLPKGDVARGVAYAFTTGMMPWAKESTRIHAVAYLRGVAFHVGILAGLAALFASPWWALLPRTVLVAGSVVLAVGALLGAAGGVARLIEPNLRALSTPDDHFAVWLVTLFLASGAAALWDRSLVIAFDLVGAAMLAYVPLGKIRHCLYYFSSRAWFGRFFGRRAVLPHPQPIR